MVVVNKWIVGKCVWIRGYNNWGTLETGLKGYYDNANRDVNRNKLWHDRGNGSWHFGTTSVSCDPLYVVPFTDYQHDATVVMQNYPLN